MLPVAYIWCDIHKTSDEHRICS